MNDCCGCGDCDDEVAEDDCEEDEAAPADDAASRPPTWGLRPIPLSAPPPAAEDESGSQSWGALISCDLLGQYGIGD